MQPQRTTEDTNEEEDNIHWHCYSPLAGVGFLLVAIVVPLYCARKMHTVFVFA